MKTVICIIMLWLLSTAGIAQGCLPQNPRIKIRGMTCPGCIYDYKDSVYSYDEKLLWAEIEFWPDSVYFAEAIPFDLWNRKRKIVLADNLWGTTVCAVIQSFSALREGTRQNFGFYLDWHTQLYIEAIVTEELSLGEWVYIVHELCIIDRYHGQQFGIQRYEY